MHEGAVLGQGLDVVGTAYDPEVAYALKTGSYTVRGPLRLGALLGGADARTLRALDRFSAPVGIAFQLADDLLSAFGSSAVTGKALGNDLRAGKRTSLLLTGLRRARGGELRALKSVVGKLKASDAEVARALGVLESSGARAAVERRIEELLKTGLAALSPGVSRSGRELLEGAALALTSRRS
jgi:geranylgeranyl diphosphate synthase type I